MQKQPQIIVTIGTDGETTVEADGVIGKGCEALTKPMEDALGSRQSDKKKPEYQQQNRQARAHGQSAG